MRMNRTIEEEINDFLNTYGPATFKVFLEDVEPLYDLYNSVEDEDWMEACDDVGEVNDIRLIRSVYLMSKIADLHALNLSKMRNSFRGLWIRMTKEAKQWEKEQEQLERKHWKY
jgi:hypothetical protein